MSEEIEREALRAKNKIKQEFCGEFLVFLGEAMLNPGKITPENFMRTVSGRVSHVRNEMANVNTATEEGIVLNEKGEAAKMVPVEKPRKRKPIKKIVVTEKKFLGLWNEVMNQLSYYEDGKCYMSDVKERVKEVMTKFADDNNL